MTTRTELLELIRNGENSLVEFKRDALDARRLAQELVAFTNQHGGRVLLGVDDDGSVVGLQRADLEQFVMNVSRDKVRPEIIPTYEVIRDVGPGKDVAVVTLEPGYAVHAVWHDNRRSYYIRVGTQSREANEEELSRLLQQRSTLRAELRPVGGTDLKHLDRRRLRDYFVRVRDQGLPEDDDSLIQVLTATEILSGEGSATTAGLLLFGTDPGRRLPHAGITAAAYTGTEKDYATSERGTFRRPLVALGPPDQLIETGLIEDAIAFITRNASSASRVEAGQRVDLAAYPSEAIREVLVNAVVHRDYLLSGTDIELSLYADRLEVTSPGRLPNGVTVGGMRIGLRAARNQLVKDVMSDYRYLEHMGMGVPRKIIAGMQAHNGTEPDLIVSDERFMVRLWRQPPGES